MNIHPAVYCITDWVSLRSVIRALKDQDPSLSMLVVPRVIWDRLNKFSFHWEARRITQPEPWGAGYMRVPIVDNVAILLLGVDGRLY